MTCEFPFQLFDSTRRTAMNSLTPITPGATHDPISPSRAFEEARALYKMREFCAALTRLRHVIRCQPKGSAGYEAALRLALHIFCAMGDAAAAERVHNRLVDCKTVTRHPEAPSESRAAAPAETCAPFRPLRSTRQRSWHVTSLDRLAPSTCFHLRMPFGTRTNGVARRFRL